ncbi:hypothetical protein [Parafrankia sp. BMG5.11]|uniref:hypothetical protein n=1 Tax=Parafrankia sp. BMG5.11 TaxID=222540 RepID=UPI00103957D0|nr:hypothetical protein [Parafrankia sp. BMG5.11]TCJ39204.1 hypothetical protein E0504_08625 [Parafrankia sp. BMG5.11]
MPIKQRREKLRPFNDYHREQLIDGPDACLLAGVGYLTAATWDQMSDKEQASALEDMQADWTAHGAIIMRWWNQEPGARPITSKPWVFPVAGGPDALPWAAEQFGEPPCQ